MSLTGGVLTAVPTTLPRAAAEVAIRALLRAGDNAVLSSARSGDEPPVTIPRDPAREAARRELSKRMYHENDPSLFQRALNAFWDWVDKLFGSAAAATPGGTLGLVVIIVAVLSVLGALWWRLGTPHRDRPRRPPCSTTAPAAPPNTARPPRHMPPRATGTRPSRNACAPSSAPWRSAPSSTSAPAAPRTKQPPTAGRTLPAHTDRLRAAARDFDDVTYGGRSGERAVVPPHGRTRPRPGPHQAPARGQQPQHGPQRPPGSRRMTTEATLPTTSASPTARQVWTRARGIALAVLLLLAAAVAIAVIRSDARHGELDPRSADPYGSRAVAELLADRGVTTRVVTTLDEARAAASPGHHPPGRRPRPADAPSAVAAALRDRRLRRPHRPGRPRQLVRGTARPRCHRGPRHQLRPRRSPPTATCPPPAARALPTRAASATRPHTSAPTSATPARRLATLLRIPDDVRGRRHRRPRRTRHPLQRPPRRAGQRLARPSTPRLPPSSGLVPPLALRQLGHRHRRQTGLLRPAPLRLALGHAATLRRGSPRRPLAGTPTRPPRARKTPRGDPRLRNRRRPRPPLPQGQRPRPRSRRSSLRHPHPPRPPRRRLRRPGARARGPAPRSVRPSPTAPDRPCTPSSSARRPATTRPSSPSPTNSTPSKERYAVHDGPDH